VCNWPELVTSKFAARHTVEGNISQQKAVDVCRQRSADGDRNFTSTSLAESLIKDVVNYLAKNVIEWHGKNIKGFANYHVDVKGTMWTVVCHAGKGFAPTCYQDSVVVGIDQSGLINHFHGDAQYASGKIYKK
jgi:hypothetical protein